jgi:transposase
MRILWYDGQGFLLTTKRLSKGKFSNWPSSEELASCISGYDASALLAGGFIGNRKKDWKRVA